MFVVGLLFKSERRILLLITTSISASISRIFNVVLHLYLYLNHNLYKTKLQSISISILCRILFVHAASGLAARLPAEEGAAGSGLSEGAASVRPDALIRRSSMVYTYIYIYTYVTMYIYIYIYISTHICMSIHT